MVIYQLDRTRTDIEVKKAYAQGPSSLTLTHVQSGACRSGLPLRWILDLLYLRSSTTNHRNNKVLSAATAAHHPPNCLKEMNISDNSPTRVKSQLVISSYLPQAFPQPSATAYRWSRCAESIGSHGAGHHSD